MFYIVRMCQVIRLNPCDYLYKVLIKRYVPTDENNNWNETWDWAKGQKWSSSINLALNVSRTHGIIPQLVRASESNMWSWVQIPIKPTFYTYFKESIIGEYYMYHVILTNPCDNLYKVSTEINLVTEEGNSQYEIWDWTKWWIWNSCTKLAMNANRTHGLISQSVRASKRNSVVAGLSPNQANFLYLLQKILQILVPYVSGNSATCMWIPLQSVN